MKREVVVLVDDLTGGDADETVRYALDGVNYEIDLNTANATKLREALERYVAVSRRTAGKSARILHSGGRQRPTRSDTPAPPISDRALNKVIREWAKRRGMPVSDRGRVPADIVRQYRGLS